MLYYGEEHWNGPFRLKDMMPPFSGETEALFFDYGIDLVQIIDSEHYIFHNEAVRTVFEGAGALLRGDLDFISKNYDRPIPAEEAILIALISGSDVLQEQTKREERVNMCTAMARLEEECRKRGFREGIVRKAKELAIKLYKRGNSLETIAELVEVQVPQIEEWIKEES